MIIKHPNNQISFDRSDIVAAFRAGDAELVFLKSEPDQFGRTLCCKRWDDPFLGKSNSADWFFCLGYNEDARTDIDADIADRAVEQGQFKFFDQMYEGF